MDFCGESKAGMNMLGELVLRHIFALNTQTSKAKALKSKVSILIHILTNIYIIINICSAFNFINAVIHFVLLRMTIPI